MLAEHARSKASTAVRAPQSPRVRRLVYFGTALLLLGLGSSVAAAGNVSLPFEAIVEGTFGVMPGPGNSGLFVVQEEGEGEADGLGAFAFVSSMPHNSSNVPRGCEVPSSTAVGGWGAMTFDGGSVLLLRRVSGQACVEGLDIAITENWVITGGTGAFHKATGRLLREGTAEITSFPPSGPFDGTFSGRIWLR